MCDTCGCNVTPGNEHLVAAGGHLSRTPGGNESVEVLKGLLDANDHQAAHNREHFERHNTIEALGDEFKVAVVEGDLETENDAERIRRKGVPAVQISTGSACHLDAHMVHSALHDLDLDGIDVVFIENVGNLVCPASFDLGQHLNVTLLSTPEGHDKPAKYPVMFRAADLVVIAKADLLPVLDDFDPEYATSCLRQLASQAPVMEVSARSGAGVNEWLGWVRAELATVQRANEHERKMGGDGA
jgi:hydrogenase nickel incorporation protein HypB